MKEVIVYTLVGNGGGIDGMDHTNKGGEIRAAYLTRDEAENDKRAPWCKINPIVLDLDKAKSHAKAKLDPIDKLALNLK